MKFLDVFVNEGVLAAEMALKDASSDLVVEECRNYIQHLKSYRLDLRELRCLSDDTLFARSALSRELLYQARSAVRAIIEITVRETNRTEKLLDFLTSINVHQAAEILNVCRYLGSNNWEANSGGVRFANGFDTGQMSVDTAVTTASRLRREAYVVINRKMDPESAFPAARQSARVAPVA
jgi:16S rRNA G966 N2-methylase RsmD